MMMFPTMRKLTDYFTEMGSRQVLKMTPPQLTYNLHLDRLGIQHAASRVRITLPTGMHNAPRCQELVPTMVGVGNVLFWSVRWSMNVLVSFKSNSSQHEEGS